MGTKSVSAVMTEEQSKEIVLNYFKGDQLATDVWWSKYRLVEGGFDERHPHDMFERCSTNLAEKEAEMMVGVIDRLKLPTVIDNLSEYGKKHFSQLLADQERNLLADQERNYLEETLKNLYMGMLNGFECSVMGGSLNSGIGNLGAYQSLSNCFVLGQPHDSYAGIIMKEHDIIQVEKRRGGAGVDLSTIRPEMAEVKNQSKYACGPLLYLNRYSNATREVSQNGRRGALMASIRIAHPDVLGIVNVKRDKTKVTGANVSVIVSDEFMEAVFQETDFVLRFPVTEPVPAHVDVEALEYGGLVRDEQTGMYLRKIKAIELWNEIVRSNYECAEPGIMWEGRFINYSTDGVYSQYKYVTSNPCGEIGMGEFDACRLVAMNLFSCVDNPFTTQAKVNFAKLYEYSYNQMLLANTIIDLEVDYIKNIIDKIERTSGDVELMEFEKRIWVKILNVCQQGRRCGCGFLGLGDMLASIGEPYKASPIVEEVMKTKMKAELDATIDLAIIKQPFDGWLNALENNEMFSMIEETFPEQHERMVKFGRRNVSWSTMAPTGSGGIIAQLTGGIEPLFSPYYKRRKKCMSSSDRVDFTDVDGEQFTEYFVIHPKLQKHCEIKYKVVDWDHVTEDELKVMFEASPYFGNCAEDIVYEDRVDMQSLIQKYTTHSISSTINLPKDVKVDTIDQIYRTAYLKGLKGVTVYRDGSRGGIMVSSNNEDKSDWFGEVKAPKRPDVIESDLHIVRYDGDFYCVIVGLLNNKPYECFVCYVKEMPEMSYPVRGEIVKRGTDRYCFYSQDLDINDIQNCDASTKIFGLMVSTMLRHRIPLKKIAKTLRKSEMLINEFSNKILHVLTQYIPNGEVDDFCEECWEQDKIKIKMTYQNGCCMCPNGHSKC